MLSSFINACTIKHPRTYVRCSQREIKSMIAKREVKMNLTYQSILPLSGQRTFKYRGTKIWNALDGELNWTTNLKHFKSILKTRLQKEIYDLVFNLSY